MELLKLRRHTWTINRTGTRYNMPTAPKADLAKLLIECYDAYAHADGMQRMSDIIWRNLASNYSPVDEWEAIAALAPIK
jgi:hypothetical protein